MTLVSESLSLVCVFGSLVFYGTVAGKCQYLLLFNAIAIQLYPVGASRMNKS